MISGFSKYNREERIKFINGLFDNEESVSNLLDTFRLKSENIQNIIEKLSENNITNFHLPYGIAPNFMINGKEYVIPMVIEESSVVAAASNAAKFWYNKGGFHAKVNNILKEGQIHFTWNGSHQKIEQSWPSLKKELIDFITPHIKNMLERGGGIREMELCNKSDQLENYFQIRVKYDTVEAMGANFINSSLEKMASKFREIINHNKEINPGKHDLNIIMAILSNYTPECVVDCHVECDPRELDKIDGKMPYHEFTEKFKLAVDIAHIDPYRAVTHNKGIFNGIDAVVLATGNDFRAIEASGHAYAAKNGHYKSLSSASLQNNKFRLQLSLPLALGTIGGITSVHPLTKFSFQLLNNPTTEKLIHIVAAAGLANHFSAIKSLVTNGIQHGHMKMHLSNMLEQLNTSTTEQTLIREYFRNKTVSFTEVSDYVQKLRKK